MLGLEAGTDLDQLRSTLRGVLQNLGIAEWEVLSIAVGQTSIVATIASNNQTTLAVVRANLNGIANTVASLAKDSLGRSTTLGADTSAASDGPPTLMNTTTAETGTISVGTRAVGPTVSTTAANESASDESTGTGKLSTSGAQVVTTASSSADAIPTTSANAPTEPLQATGGGSGGSAVVIVIVVVIVAVLIGVAAWCWCRYKKKTAQSAQISDTYATPSAAMHVYKEGSFEPAGSPPPPHDNTFAETAFVETSHAAVVDLLAQPMQGTAVAIDMDSVLPSQGNSGSAGASFDGVDPDGYLQVQDDDNTLSL